jgi:hypothetical protein
VTVQAFSIVTGLIELDVFGSRRRLEIVHIDMLQPAELCRIVGVARIASLIGRNAVILKVRRG